MVTIEKPLINTEKLLYGFIDNILEELILRFQNNLENHKCYDPYEIVIKSRLLKEIKDNLINLNNHYKNKENEWYQDG